MLVVNSKAGLKHYRGSILDPDGLVCVISLAVHRLGAGSSERRGGSRLPHPRTASFQVTVTASQQCHLAAAELRAGEPAACLQRSAGVRRRSQVVLLIRAVC